MSISPAARITVITEDFNLRLRIVQERRPTFGTRRIAPRWGRCILLAAYAMQKNTLPAGSVLVVADAYSTHEWKPRMRTRRAWVDLPNGRSWEPVECTTLPTTRHYQLADPEELVAWRTRDELRAALREVGGGITGLNALINGGVPRDGLVWPTDDEQGT